MGETKWKNEGKMKKAGGKQHRMSNVGAVMLEIYQSINKHFPN